MSKFGRPSKCCSTAAKTNVFMSRVRMASKTFAARSLLYPLRRKVAFHLSGPGMKEKFRPIDTKGLEPYQVYSATALTFCEPPVHDEFRNRSLFRAVKCRRDPQRPARLKPFYSRAVKGLQKHLNARTNALQFPVHPLRPCNTPSKISGNGSSTNLTSFPQNQISRYTNNSIFLTLTTSGRAQD